MPGWVLLVADLVVGVALAASGSVVLLRRKERRIGVLFLLAAATWFAGSVWAPLVFLHRGPIVHLHLSYPTGRLRRWPAIVATVVAYAWAVVEGWVSQPAVTAGVAVLMAAAATDGYLRTRGPARKAALPAFIAALLFAAVLALSALNVLWDLRADAAVALGYDAVIVLVAVWLTADLLRGSWTDAALADLVTQVGGASDAATGVEAELRRALGDPMARVGYWDAARSSFRDARGRAIEAGEHTVTVADDGGHPLAVLEHDPALDGDPALVEGAAAVLRLVVSNAQLSAQIHARVDELAAARDRIVDAADEQRRALRIEIAGGPRAALSAARSALTAAGPDASADAPALIAGIDDADRELDRFARGLRPGGFESGGLGEAIERLAARSGLPVEVRIEVGRLDPSIETAIWFVCAESLTNAVKHAHARHVRLDVDRSDGVVRVDVVDDGVGGADPSGSGLVGLSRRVRDLGGELRVTDRPRGGTLVSARIPAGGIG